MTKSSSKALILDGSKKGDHILEAARRIVEEEFKDIGTEVTSLTLRDIQIAPCLGCFGCWIRTPGVCIINDAGRDVGRIMAQSDLLVFITPIIFGGYSPELKKAVDRMISIVLPFFIKVKGEVHHKRRYVKYQNLMAIGRAACKDDRIRDIFEKLVERNAINSQAPSYASLILSDDEAIDSVHKRIKKTVHKIAG